MNSKAALLKCVVSRLEPWLESREFTRLEYKQPWRVYAREVGEVVWIFALTRLPGSGPDAVLFSCELVVHVPDLNHQLGQDQENWTLAPIRLSLGRLPRFPEFEVNDEETWSCNSAETCETASDEIISILDAKGMAFLAPINNKTAVASELRKGGPHINRGRQKALYDAEILEGSINPEQLLGKSTARPNIA